MPQKGSKFEREICKLLSMWWTGQERDDVFWRSTTSGARATTRAKKGKRTFGQYGDVAFTDEIGRPLLDLVTIELKRGYNSDTMQDLLDTPPHGALRKWEKWITKAEEDSRQAGTFSYLLIVRRDQREALVVMPCTLWGMLPETPFPRTQIETESFHLYITTLEAFLELDPEAFVELAGQHGIQAS